MSYDNGSRNTLSEWYRLARQRSERQQRLQRCKQQQRKYDKANRHSRAAYWQDMAAKVRAEIEDIERAMVREWNRASGKL